MSDPIGTDGVESRDAGVPYISIEIPPKEGQGELSNSEISTSSSLKLAFVPIDEHLMEIEEVCARYGTSFSPEVAPMRNIGLTTEQVNEYMRMNGALNQLSPPTRTSALRRFMVHLFDLFNVLLMVAGFLSLLLFATIKPSTLENLYLGIVLFVVSLTNAMMGFIQEYRTASLLASFKVKFHFMCNS